MENNITMKDVSDLFGAINVIRKFKIKAGSENFSFSNAENIFEDVLTDMKNGHYCQNCGTFLKFYIKK